MKKISMLRHEGDKRGLPDCFCRESYDRVKKFHESMADYAYTPLVKAERTAARAGIGELYVKDESARYGLNAFKALGAAYAMGNMEVPEDAVFVTATDGNHGRAVAWAAARMGHRSVVFMPAGTVRARAEAVKSISGATVYVTDLNYDDTVRKAAAYARDRGGYLVQDTAFAGYEEIPRDICLGYTRLMEEALEQMGERVPTHVFLQAGVGSMAGGVTGYLADVLGDRCPVISVMEAEGSACIYESVRQGGYVTADSGARTIMAGLNCGEANIFTLEILRDYASFFFKVPDPVAVDGMKAMREDGVTAGECGGIGPGLLLNLDDAMRKELGLNEDSIVLLISTEGATDPEFYERNISGVRGD